MMLGNFQQMIEHELLKEWTIISAPLDAHIIDDWPNKKYYINLGTLKQIPPIDNIQNYVLYVLPRKIIDALFNSDEILNFETGVLIFGYKNRFVISELKRNDDQYVLKMGITIKLDRAQQMQIFSDAIGEIYSNLEEDAQSGYIINAITYTNPSERNFSRWPDNKNIIRSIVVPKNIFCMTFLNNIFRVIYPLMRTISQVAGSLEFLISHIKFLSSSYNSITNFKNNTTLCIKTTLSLKDISTRYFAHAMEDVWHLPKKPIEIEKSEYISKKPKDSTDTFDIDISEDILLKPEKHEKNIETQKTTIDKAEIQKHPIKSTKPIEAPYEKKAHELPSSFTPADKLHSEHSEKIEHIEYGPDIKYLQNEITQIKTILDKIMPIDFSKEIKKSLTDLKSITMRITKLENEFYELKKEISKKSPDSKDANTEKIIQDIIEKNEKLSEHLEIIASRIEELLRDE